MKKEYDFSDAKRANFRKRFPPKRELDRRTKVRITIMLDLDILDFFKACAAKAGAEPYQTQINRALREYVAGTNPAVTEALRRVTERAARYSVPTSARTGARRGRGRRGGKRMRLQRTIKAVVRPGEDAGYVAECVEVPVVTQGRSLDEVTRNLQEAVGLHLADEDPSVLGLVPDPTIVVTLELNPSEA